MMMTRRRRCIYELTILSQQSRPVQRRKVVSFASLWWL
jgi:hypothetical protein